MLRPDPRERRAWPGAALAAAMSVCTLLASAAPAHACSITAPDVQMRAPSVAQAMVDSAAAVDVLVLEDADRLRWRDPNAPRGRGTRQLHRLEFRVERRLIGQAPTAFRTQGFVDAPASTPRAELAAWFHRVRNAIHRRVYGKDHPISGVHPGLDATPEKRARRVEEERRTRAGWERGADPYTWARAPRALSADRYADPGYDCSAPFYGRSGVRYLMFRDARGELLTDGLPVFMDGKPTRIAGPAFTPIIETPDPWLKAVERAVAVRLSRTGG